ncbi:MAG: hypothetical protein P8175_13345 [Deltaproteobacteria bacterium]
MAEKRDSSVTAEVERRLEYFFGESDEGFVSSDDSMAMQETPLRDLKALVLSIDWEITDETMGRFVKQIERCEEFYKQDKDSTLFLQLLASLGKYIKASRAKAHPNAMKVMKSVYNALEKAALSRDMSEAEREKILLVEVVRFKELKQQIAQRKAEKEKKAKARPSKSRGSALEGEEVKQETEVSGHTFQRTFGPDWNRMTPHEAFGYALEEIRQVIKAEFQALRAELRLWREAE